MEKNKCIESLKLLKDGTDKDLQKSLQNLDDLMIKLRHIGILLSGPAENDKILEKNEQELTDDLYLIKQLLINFNRQCETRIPDLKSTKIFIDDNKMINFPRYPMPDFTKYLPGYEIEGGISFLKDYQNGIFFMIDQERKAGFENIYKLLQQKKDLVRISDVKTLESGDLVAVYVEEQMTRALVEVNHLGISLFMFDLGEECPLEEDFELYEMAEYYKHLPAQAILCKLSHLPSKSVTKKWFHQNLYRTVKVKVVGTEYNTLLVSVLHPEMEEIVDSDSASVLTSVTQYSNTNPFVSDLAKDDLKRLNDFNNDEMKEFMNDEVTSTSNAMVAVLGYDPKDEARYCKHFDETTGGCFKGVNCHLIHQKPLADGWTRDKVETYVDIPEKIPLPIAHEQILIEMSVVEDIHLFYGYILTEKFHRSTAMSLNELNLEINRADKLRKYKSFTKILPCVNELVLAPYLDSYYRARVVSVDHNSVEVFFVDYGNYASSPIKDLYCWEPQFGQIPFQAMFFQVAGIQPIKATPKSVRVDELFRHLTKRKVTAVVLANQPNILVRVFLNSTTELTDILKTSGLADVCDNNYYHKEPSIVPV
ncbi:uncharacterized protein LOC134834777 [Culicoides brevitarsis]|uniref:uncharacterized protein LOC134834777 n=1 Tax=Culicoides brevitarsis TaxID=469753 RepID=UPI00307CC2DE